MSFQNPSSPTEVLYGASGDVRDEINAYMLVATGGHYADEKELAGSLIINSLRKSTRIINGYLEPVYSGQIPFVSTTDVPVLLDEIASDIATYYVLRSLSAKVGQLSEEKKQDYYGDYVGEDGLLTKISERLIGLPELASEFGSDAKGTAPIWRAPIFNVGDEISQEIDPRTIDDIDDDRG